MNKWLLIMVLLSGILSCKPKVNLEGFDNEVFKNDKLACTGKRAAQQADFEKIRLNLRGLSENEILQVLGKPDLQMLSVRNQKYYIYFLEKGEQCQNKFADSKSKTAVFRFNAVNLVTEITYETGKPE
jgi:hypothetical protein